MKLYRPEEMTPELVAKLRFEPLTPEEFKEVMALARASSTTERPMKNYRPEEITPDVLANLKYEEVTPEELDTVLALARTVYSEAELQLHLEVDLGVPFEQLIGELEEAQRQRDEGAR